jgi:hypothetical protein
MGVLEKRNRICFSIIWGFQMSLKMAVFDMDGVLVDIDSSWQLIHRAFGTDND